MVSPLAVYFTSRSNPASRYKKNPGSPNPTYGFFTGQLKSCIHPNSYSRTSPGHGIAGKHTGFISRISPCRSCIGSTIAVISIQNRSFSLFDGVVNCPLIYLATAVGHSKA